MQIDLNEIEKATPYFYNQITDYRTWSSLGFALANLGETGRSFFIDISLNQKDYTDNEESLNREYSRILSKNKGTTKLNTFFYYAKQYGYDVKEKPGTKNYTKINIKTVIKPTIKNKIDLKLLRNKRQYIELFNILFNYPKAKDRYFIFDRGLSIETIKEAEIKTLNISLNVYDDNQSLKHNEDEKSIYNLDQNKGILKQLSINLCKELKAFSKAKETDIKDFLQTIGILTKTKTSRFFRNYLQDYLIPCYDNQGNIINIQFTTSYETREKYKNKNLQKYYYLNNLPGETAPLFYYPPYFKSYDHNEPIYITEGIIDSLSLRDSLFSKVQSIALFSANFTIDKKKLQEIKELEKFKSIFLLIEDDKQGKQARKQLKKSFNKDKTTILSNKKLANYYNVNSSNIKDVNDILKQLKESK